MEKLLEILNDIQPDADYETCTTLIDDEVLDSFAILSIVGELEEAFDIEITPVDIVPENFNSVQAAVGYGTASSGSLNSGGETCPLYQWNS